MKDVRYIKPAVFIACLMPLLFLFWKGFTGNLGANPIEVVTHSTGLWTLTFLALTLAITPLRKVMHQLWLIKFRRMLGLFAFFYGTLHLMTYVWLDKFFDVHEILHDVARRKFITVGFAAFVLMVPLAVTSTRGWISRLGGKRWQLLHRLVYFSAVLGVIHFLWLVKKDITEPARYGLVVGLLLGYRVVNRLWIRTRRPPAVPRTSLSKTPA